MLASVPVQHESLSSLRRTDDSILSVHFSAPMATMYSFADGRWSLSGVQGPLFLCRRSRAPEFALVVLNQRSLANLLVDIGPDSAADTHESLLVLSHPLVRARCV